MICNSINFSTDTHFIPFGTSPSIIICMSTSLSADISIIFVCRLVFIFIFVFILFVICITTAGSVRLSIIANICLIFDLHYSVIFLIRVCISEHGCTSIGTSLCINAFVLIQVLVFI